MTIDPEKSQDYSFKNPGILADVKSRDPGITGIPLGPDDDEYDDDVDDYEELVSQDNEGVRDVVPPGLLHMLGRKESSINQFRK